jgi:hypothetical protein
MVFAEGSLSPGQNDGWRGLDLSRRSEDIGPGSLAVATNFTLDGDDLLSRPGRVGQLTSALGSPIRAAVEFDGGAVFVAGGKLYRWLLGGASATEILQGGSSLSLVSDSVQTATALSVAYLVDGSGVLRRTDGTTAAALTELDTPGAPVATVHHETLTSLSSLTWTQNFITGTTATPASSGAGGTIAPANSIVQPDSDFWNASNLTGTGFWNTRAGAPSYSPNIQDGNGGNAVELDSDTGVGDSVQSDAILLNAAQTSGYARVAVVSYEAAAEDSTTNSEVVDLDIAAYSDTGGSTLITGSVKSWQSPFLFPDKSLQVRQLVDLRGLATAPRSIKVGFSQPIIRGTNQGADVNRVSLFVPRMELGLVASSDNRLAVRQGTVQVWQGFGSTASLAGSLGGQSDPSLASAGRLLTAGLTIDSTLPATANWTGARTLALEILPAAGLSGLNLRLGFKVGSDWFYTDPLDIPSSSSPDASVWGVAELRSVAASLTAVTDIRVEILSDVLLEGLQEGGDQVLFRLGELRNAGNLPEGRPVWYKLVEVDDAGDATNLLDVVYSDGSKGSGDGQLVEGSRASRMARLVLPARTNSGAELFALYRFGGSYIPTNGETALGRLVCLVSWATGDFAFGGDTDKGSAPRIVAFKNPYISWDKTGSTGAAGSILIDNTPDSFLAGSDVYLSGREKAPTAPSAVAAWDNRLWLATGADVFASWRIEAGRTAGLYWSRLQLPESTDPDAARKGHWERLLLPPGDSIRRMIPLPDSLVILTTARVFVVRRSGDVVPAYSISRLYDSDASGVVSPLAACELDGRVWWLALDGLRVTDGQSVQRVAGELWAGIVSRALATLQSAVLSACPSSRKLFLRLGDDLYVYHLGREDSSGRSVESGWTLWQGCDSRAALDVSGSLHLAGESGQLWKMSGDTDPSGSIAVAMTTRKYGGDLEESGAYWLLPERIRLNLETSASASIVVLVTGDSSDLSSSATQTVPTGAHDWSFRAGPGARGRWLSLSLSGSVAGRLRVRGTSLEATRRKRS